MFLRWKDIYFSFKKGVKFSDGSDFNANNVKKNFDSIFLIKKDILGWID